MEMLINIPFRTAMILSHSLRDNIPINRTIYGHETSSLTLKGRNKFIMFLIKFLGQYLDPSG